MWLNEVKNVRLCFGRWLWALNHFLSGSTLPISSRLFSSGALRCSESPPPLPRLKFPVPFAGSSPFLHLLIVGILYGSVLSSCFYLRDAVCGCGFSWYCSVLAHLRSHPASVFHCPGNHTCSLSSWPCPHTGCSSCFVHFAVMLMNSFQDNAVKTQTASGLWTIIFPQIQAKKFLLISFFVVCFNIFIYVFLAVLGLHCCVGFPLVTVSRATL